MTAFDMQIRMWRMGAELWRQAAEMQIGAVRQVVEATSTLAQYNTQFLRQGVRTADGYRSQAAEVVRETARATAATAEDREHDTPAGRVARTAVEPAVAAMEASADVSDAVGKEMVAAMDKMADTGDALAKEAESAGKDAAEKAKNAGAKAIDETAEAGSKAAAAGEHARAKRK